MIILMKLFIFILFFATLPVYSEYLGSAYMDPEYESRWYDIYQTYHSQRTAQEEWRSIITSKNVNTYTVQQGDTLWDISRVLFADSNYWPKLWSVNQDISNPHQIEKGQNLYVVLGDESSAPKALLGSVPTAESAAGESQFCNTDIAQVFQKEGFTKVYDTQIKCRKIKQKMKDRKRKDQKELNEFLLSENAVVSVPKAAVRPFLNSIPSSLPILDLIREEPKINFENLGTITDRAAVSVLSNYVMDRDDIGVVGTVKSLDTDGGVTLPTSEIILRLDIPARVGSQLSLIHPLKKLSSPVPLFIRGPFGYEVILQAVVTVTSAIPNQEGLYYAQVNNVYNPVSQDAVVVEGQPAQFSFSGAVRPGGGSAQITGVPKDQSAQALTIHSFVYLNRGKSGQMQVGDTLRIWANPFFHKKNKPRPLGDVLIVHTDSQVATGFITRMSGLAFVGDYARPQAEANQFELDSETDDIFIDQDSTFENEEEEEEALDDASSAQPSAEQSSPENMADEFEEEEDVLEDVSSAQPPAESLSAEDPEDEFLEEEDAF